MSPAASLSTSTAPDILSVDFFHLYDQLGHDALTLDDETSNLQEAKQKRDQLQFELNKQQRELRKLRGFIREQRNRISLVSTHWFYGTTILQPQLWFRGGCKGKIERARVKLTKAQEEELPTLQSTIQVVQEEQLPPLQRAVDEQLERFELSANAASRQETMRERAFAEHPSPKLLEWGQQKDSLEQRISIYEREAENLDDVISQLFDSQAMYQRAKVLLEDALKHNEKYQTLKDNPLPIPKPAEVLQNRQLRRSETQVADGTKIVFINNGSTKDLFHVKRDGKIYSTNYPCPNGCGHLVTWHETHCCDACRRGASEHDQHCERKLLSTQRGAQQKMDVWIKQQQTYFKSMTWENDNCNKKFMEARKEAKKGERTIRKALSSISIFVRERYSTVCSSLVWDATSSIPTLPHGGCTCSKIRASNIRQEMDKVDRAQTVLSEQVLGTVQQLMAQVRHDTQGFGLHRQNLEKNLEDERNRIFHRLRAQVMGAPVQSPLYEEETTAPPPAFAPPIIATPSSPTEENQAMSNMYSFDSMPQSAEPSATDNAILATEELIRVAAAIMADGA